MFASRKLRHMYWVAHRCPECFMSQVHPYPIPCCPWWMSANVCSIRKSRWQKRLYNDLPGVAPAHRLTATKQSHNLPTCCGKYIHSIIHSFLIVHSRIRRASMFEGLARTTLPIIKIMFHLPFLCSLRLCSCSLSKMLQSTDCLRRLVYEWHLIPPFKFA